MDLIEYKLIQEKTFRRHPWELTRERFLHFILDRLTVSRNLADTGSGDGYLAASVAKRYPKANVTAIDINYTNDLLEHLQQNKPANLHFTKDIYSIPSDLPLNAILLMDVLEHIENPETLLKELLQLNMISQETRFVITVPAFQQLFSVHDKNLGHYRRYNLKQLNSLLAPLSLEMEYRGYFFNSLLPVRFLQKLIEKKVTAGKQESIHNWKGGSLLTSFLTGWFWTEFKITWYLARLGIRIPGLTCYCICRYVP